MKIIDVGDRVLTKGNVIYDITFIDEVNNTYDGVCECCRELYKKISLDRIVKILKKRNKWEKILI